MKQISSGLALMHAGQYAGALQLLVQEAQAAPGDAVAQDNLGRCLYFLKKPEFAEACFRQATKIKPDFFEAHNNLGIILRDLGRFEESVASHRRAIELKPDYAEAYVNLGVTLSDLGRIDEAVLSYQCGIAAKPDFAEAHNNLGNALKDLNQLDEAIACFRTAIKLSPDYNEAHANLGFVLLMAGEFAEGWKENEYRWHLVPKEKHPATKLPQWTGQAVKNSDRLLIYCEQGFGDQLQFARYIRLAAARFPGGVSVVVDPPLQCLFRRSFPEIEIVEKPPGNQSAWQLYCPLLSLPLALGTVLESKPYLIADPERVAAWQSKIDGLKLDAGARKIGIVWKPGAGMLIAKLKALSFSQLAPLLAQPNAAFFSLQKEPDPESVGKLVDWSAEFKDFDDTAALIMNLDLVISVDTSVAHLAGALGKPVWLFNRHASEWRWMRGREYSPWYPTIRIFTQERAGNWDEVVARMAVTFKQL